MNCYVSLWCETYNIPTINNHNQDLIFSDSKIHLKVKGHDPGCDIWCLQHEVGHRLSSYFKLTWTESFLTFMATFWELKNCFWIDRFSNEGAHGYQRILSIGVIDFKSAQALKMRMVPLMPEQIGTPTMVSVKGPEARIKIVKNIKLVQSAQLCWWKVFTWLPWDIIEMHCCSGNLFWHGCNECKFLGPKIKKKWTKITIYSHMQ